MTDISSWARSVYDNILNSIGQVIGGTLTQKFLEPIVTKFLWSNKGNESKISKIKSDTPNTVVHVDDSELSRDDQATTSRELFPCSVIDKTLSNSKRCQGFPVPCATDSNLNLVQIRNGNGMISGFDISSEFDNSSFWEHCFEIPYTVSPFGGPGNPVTNKNAFSNEFNDFTRPINNIGDMPSSDSARQYQHYQQQQQQRQQPSTNSKLVMRSSKANSMSRVYPYLSQQQHQQQRLRQCSTHSAPLHQQEVANSRQIQQPGSEQPFLDFETPSTITSQGSFDTFSPPELERHHTPPSYFTTSPEDSSVVSGFVPNASNSSGNLAQQSGTSLQQPQQHMLSFEPLTSSETSRSIPTLPDTSFIVGDHDIIDPLNYAPAPASHPVMVNGIYPSVHSRANSDMGGSPVDDFQHVLDVEKPIPDDIWPTLNSGFSSSSDAFAPSSNGSAHDNRDSTSSGQNHPYFDLDSINSNNFPFGHTSLIMEGISPQSSIVSVSSHHSNSYSLSDSDESPQANFSGIYGLEEAQAQPQVQAQPQQLPVQEDAKANMPFVCHVCGAGFKIKGYLTRHVKKHATEKAYTCPFYNPNDESPCHPSGGFSRRDTFKTHLKARHFEYPSGTRSEHRTKVSGTCRGCGKGFKNNDEWIEEHIYPLTCTGTLSNGAKRV